MKPRYGFRYVPFMDHAAQLPLRLFPDEIDEAGVSRFHVFNDGTICSPGGVLRRLSEILRNDVANMSAQTWKKFRLPLRILLNMQLEPGEDWHAIWTEGENASTRRQLKFLEARGHSPGIKRPVDGARMLSHPSPQYGNFDRLALHFLYDRLEQAGLSQRNFTLLTFFADGDIEQRIEYISLMKEQDRRSDHIGRRFLAPKTQTRISIPVDPMACAATLISDLELAGAPDIIMHANIVLRLNGKRPMSVLHANAHGWIIKGREDRVGCRNKRRGKDVTKAQFVMPLHVRESLIARLSAERSPIDPGRSLLEEIGLKAEDLAGPDRDTAQAAKRFLERVAIFPRPSAGTSVDAFLTYDGFRYWTIKGRRLRQAAGGYKPTLFNDGRREPTLRDYRRASITRQVLDLFARTTKGSKEREDGLKEIATKHDQSTDQSEAYAAWAYQWEAEQEALDDYAAERAAMDAHERAVLVPDSLPARNSLAESFARLSSRPRDLTE